eukprot:Nitzschia sp. Nitz4//scaffold9_size221794//103683//106193//NITZ4_001350-RA/size221794-snap-gene-0.101-mRNA-1//1//CDS//3329561013//5995//frame0
MFSKLLLLALAAPTVAFDYEIVGAGDVVLTDVSTSIGPLKTLFTDDEMYVAVEGLEWDISSGNGTDETLTCETLVDGELVATETMSLADVGRTLPSSMDCGTAKVSKGGRHTIEVVFRLDGSETSTSLDAEAYGAGVAIFPLLVILLFAILTNMVEFSLYAGIFVGSCIVNGELIAGFKNSFENYILNALADVGHAYVYLFSFFLAAVVAMMEKSGGMIGFTRDISKYATSPRSGQIACFVVGLVVFFDDYANTLLCGGAMRPLMDSLMISREKLAFFVDATAAPVASISPVSSWVGFEAGLIQDEIDKIIALEGTTDLPIETSGYGVFLQSIKYRYYPIFMLILILCLIFSQRDFGPMLIAERKTEVYKRTDGGEGSSSDQSGGISDGNTPREDQPLKTWNMIVPLAVMIFLIFYLLVQTGDDGSGEQDFMDKIESSDSYAALLWATAAMMVICLIFYMLQVVKGGEIIVPSVADLKDIFITSDSVKEEDPEPRARFLMPLRDSVDSALIGMGRIFPAAIVLTLAWASGSLMGDVGCDRLFAAWIVGGVKAEMLPTLSFIISLLMALATGTSWGTMSILFPLVTVPAYQVSNGDEIIFYSTIAGILSGSVAGDHVSPISDTTVLSSLATECGLMNHVGTQAPYVLVCVLSAIFLGTIPIGFDAWPNVIGILIGLGLLVVFVLFFCQPIISATGKFDLLTSLFIAITKNEALEQLAQDTKRAYNGEDLSGDDVDDSMNKKEVSHGSDPGAADELVDA